MEKTFLILEIISIISFAISGALVAIDKKMDIFGVAILGLTTATGGGIIRDLILGITPPISFQNPRNALIAIMASLIVFFPKIRYLLINHERLYTIAMLIFDSVGLGLFTVMGVNYAFEAGFSNNLFLSIFVGVVSGVGGGVFRDIMAGDRPFIFVKHFYACASILGALLYVGLYHYLNTFIAMILSALFIFILRICAAYFKWNLPKA